MLRGHSQVHKSAGMSRAALVAWALLPLSVSTPGCALLQETEHVYFLVKRTISVEPKHFPYLGDGKLTRWRNRSLAKRAWNGVVASNPESEFSKHYARGFLDGFADYLFWGGGGEPPPIPPRDYWRLSYHSLNGRQAINDWYAGFRHGSRECQARGYRELAVTPSSLLATADRPERTASDSESGPTVSASAEDSPAPRTTTAASVSSNDEPDTVAALFGSDTDNRTHD